MVPLGFFETLVEPGSSQPYHSFNNRKLSSFEGGGKSNKYFRLRNSRLSIRQALCPQPLVSYDLPKHEVRQSE